MLGDLIHDALALAGVTPERASAWLGRPCACEERRQKLNALTWWARRILSGRADPSVSGRMDSWPWEA